MPVHQSLCPFTSWLSPRRRRLLALSRVPSDSLPFACQFPLRNDEFPQFASSALLLLSSAGVSRVILCRIYEFEPSIPVPAPSCKLFYSITGNIKMSTLKSTFFHVFIVLPFCTIRSLFYCVFSLLGSAVVRLPLLPASHAPCIRCYASCFTSSLNSSPAEW